MMIRKNFLRNVATIVACLAVMTAFTSCKKAENRILSFEFANPPAVGVIDEAAKSISVAVPVGTNVAALTPIISISDEASISPASGVVQNFTNPVKYTVTASDGSPAVYTVTVTAESIPGGVEPQELTSPITTNTTLKDLGLPIDYFYAGTSLLEVKNNATLTIEPGVTIQFTKTGGGMDIKDGACIKALGTANKHIQFVGGATKGSWDGVYVRTNKENQFTYVDFINGGKRTDNNAGVLNIDDNNVDAAKVGISHCTISGGLLRGLYLSDNINLTAFDNNKIENVDEAPVYFQGQLARLAKFDLTSDFTNNAKPYIFVRPLTPLNETVTLSATSVPYYFATNINDLEANLTINADVTIYMAQSGAISTGSNAADIGELFINGTPEKPVTLTRLPGTSYYWNSVNFSLSSSHKIKNCIIEYSGTWSGGSRQGAIATFYDNVRLELENVVVRNSNHYGIVVSNSQNITHSNVSFSNNADGNVYYDGTVYNSLDELP